MNTTYHITPTYYQPQRPRRPSEKPPRSHWLRLLVLAFVIITGFGILGLHLSVLFSTPSAASSVPVAATAESRQLVAAIKAVTTTNQAQIGVAVYDHKTGVTSDYSTTSHTFNAASIMKLSILEKVLLNDQQANHGITADELASATPMIENSDNISASTLWNEVGGQDSMNQFFIRIGATSTQAPQDGDWGLTQTTATDQLKVINAIAYPGPVLSAASAATATALLDNVESDQQWGVSAGVPSTVTVELKDGWLPDSDTNDSFNDTDDWTMNSMGHVYGGNVDYTIVILTQGDDDQYDGIATIQNISSSIYTILSSKAA